MWDAGVARAQPQRAARCRPQDERRVLLDEHASLQAEAARLDSELQLHKDNDPETIRELGERALGCRRRLRTAAIGPPHRPHPVCSRGKGQGVHGQRKSLDRCGASPLFASLRR